MSGYFAALNAALVFITISAAAAQPTKIVLFRAKESCCRGMRWQWVGGYCTRFLLQFQSRPWGYRRNLDFSVCALGPPVDSTTNSGWPEFIYIKVDIGVYIA